VVAVSSAGSGTYGSVDVYARGGPGLERLRLSDLSDSQRAVYMGHDVFTVSGGVLFRRYPMYLDGDSNAAPSGGTAELRYSFADSVWVAAADASGS
jgi:hypothetical protein